EAGVVQRATEKAYRESNGYRFPIPGGLVEITFADVQGHAIHPTLKKLGKLTHLYQVSNGQAMRGAASQSGPGLELPDPLNPATKMNILANTLRIWVLDTKTETWF